MLIALSVQWSPTACVKGSLILIHFVLQFQMTHRQLYNNIQFIKLIPMQPIKLTAKLESSSLWIMFIALSVQWSLTAYESNLNEFYPIVSNYP